MIDNAIRNTHPDVRKIVYGDVIEAFDADEKPVEIDFKLVDAEKASLEAAEKAIAYRAKRAGEYPSMGDQLDALWKGGASASEMLSKIAAVKDKYPKPTNG